MAEENNIINELSVPDFKLLLQANPGLIFIKFGATWCKPCRVIDDIVHQYFMSVPSNVVCATLDIDDNMDLYGFMKKNRVTHGIPVILCYIKGELGIMPFDSVTGGDLLQVHSFFARCRNKLLTL